jgi:nonsense-mediated mRNA decay protein 3
MCDDCHRKEAKDTWNAVCQVRQRATHKKTFFYLEQLIIKHNAQQNTLSIKECPDGLDFFFHTRSHAQKFTEFLNAVVPIR